MSLCAAASAEAALACSAPVLCTLRQINHHSCSRGTRTCRAAVSSVRRDVATALTDQVGRRAGLGRETVTVTQHLADFFREHYRETVCSHPVSKLMPGWSIGGSRSHMVFITMRALSLT